jgi:CheY-like chemotaxis protein
MHANLLWLLVGLAAVGAAAWRIAVSLRRAKEMRAAREAAMAIALAEAQRAAKQTLARRRTDADARPPAITRTISRAPVAPPPVRPPAAVPAMPDEAQLAARAHAQRIALEAARRAKAQKAARVEAERHAALDAQAQREAEAKAAVAPAAEPPPAAPAVVVAPPPAPVAAKTPPETLIMLADDSKMVRVKTSKLLEGNAYRVITAVDGLDAVRQLETCRPDLVITDVDMPGMDGFGLARHLRGNANTAHIPIVMITSAEDRHRESALREGVGLVLGKPYPEDELLAHIRSFRFTAQSTASH